MTGGSLGRFRFCATIFVFDVCCFCCEMNVLQQNGGNNNTRQEAEDELFEKKWRRTDIRLVKSQSDRRVEDQDPLSQSVMGRGDIEYPL